MTAPLPPTLREKRRYILVKMLIAGQDLPDARHLYYAVCESVGTLFGDAGIANLNPAVIDTYGEYGIIRCRRGGERSLEAALAAVYRVGDTRIALRTIATSGTIQSLRERIPPAAAESRGEIIFEGVAYTARIGLRQKVDLFEKGIKSQKALFLIQNDIQGI